MTARILVGLLVLGFGVFFTLHVMTSVATARRGFGGRATVGFLAIPLAPFFAWRAGLRGWPIAWGIAALLYLVPLVLLSR